MILYELRGIRGERRSFFFPFPINKRLFSEEVHLMLMELLAVKSLGITLLTGVCVRQDEVGEKTGGATCPGRYTPDLVQ